MKKMLFLIIFSGCAHTHLELMPLKNFREMERRVKLLEYMSEKYIKTISKNEGIVGEILLSLRIIKKAYDLTDGKLLGVALHLYQQQKDFNQAKSYLIKLSRDLKVFEERLGLLEDVLKKIQILKGRIKRRLKRLNKRP